MSLPQIDTILYTTSLGNHNRPVFRHAVKLARLYNAKLVIQHVVKPLGETGQAMIENYLPKNVLKTIHDQGFEKLMGQMNERVRRFYQEEQIMVDNQPELEIEYVLSEGSRSIEIVKLANQRDAGLIVMGSHNSFGRSSRTTRQVIKYASRPVMVVPTRN